MCFQSNDVLVGSCFNTETIRSDDSHHILNTSVASESHNVPYKDEFSLGVANFHTRRDACTVFHELFPNSSGWWKFSQHRPTTSFIQCFKASFYERLPSVMNMTHLCVSNCIASKDYLQKSERSTKQPLQRWFKLRKAIPCCYWRILWSYKSTVLWNQNYPIWALL